jgi:hypothetical protein
VKRAVGPVMLRTVGGRPGRLGRDLRAWRRRSRVAVPAQDGVGGDDQVKSPQGGAGQVVQQSGEECPVRWGETVRGHGKVSVCGQ